jgi:hypothetical protein
LPRAYKDNYFCSKCDKEAGDFLSGKDLPFGGLSPKLAGKWWLDRYAKFSDAVATIKKWEEKWGVQKLD